MTPRHLITLCLAVVIASNAESAKRFKRQAAAPDFWWDLTLDHNAPISTVLIVPLTLEGRTEPKTGAVFDWDLEWAAGSTSVWSAGGSAYWAAWTWESKTDSAISGGGFVFNKTGEEWIYAGVSWLRDGHTGIITWNCFVDGNATAPIPWSNWDMHLNNRVESIGFVHNEKEWGFHVDSDVILSDHCANGNSVAGKRFKFLHGAETEEYIQVDPFQTATSSRRKRSPDFFDNVRQKVKDLWERTKRFFGIGQQTDGNGQDGREGQSCNTFLDLLVRLVNLIFGRQGASWCPRAGPPAGTPPNTGGTPPNTGGTPPNTGGTPPNTGGTPPNTGGTPPTTGSTPPTGGSAPPEEDFGGDPPGGANVPPPDVEEIDPSQNDAVRDWE